MSSLTAEEPIEADGVFPSAGFRALWTAISVSQLGSAVSLVTVPLIAVISLHATAGQMAWLAALDLAPSLLVRVPAAAWSDALGGRRKAFMVACNLLQGAIIGSVPLLWWAGALSFFSLLALGGVASLVAGVAASLSSPLLVQVVPKESLVSANGKLGASRSIADISGPALSGALLAVLAAPLVVIIDAVSFVMAALLLTRVRPERSGAAEAAPDTRKPASRVLALSAALARRSTVQALICVAFVNGIEHAVLALFMVRELHMRASAIGLLLSLGAVGGVAGGFLVGRVLKSLGPGRTMGLGAACTIVSLSVLPFSAPGLSSATAVALLELASSFGGTLMVATVFGELQGSAAEGTIAQVMAVSGAFLETAALLGTPAGGLLATFLGLRTTVAVAFGFLLVTLSPQLLRWSMAHWNFEETGTR